MKKIKEFIIEKLKINKSINNSFDPDNLNNDNEVIYSDLDDKFTMKSYNDFMDKVNNELNKKYEGFIVCKYNPLSWLKDKNNKEVEDTIYNYSNKLSSIFNILITDKYDNCEIKLVKGHLEVTCVNSKSKETYYIYACTKDTYNKVEEYFKGDEIDIDFLFIENNIIPIEL